MTSQRVRDPLHDLVPFSNSELEKTLWDVIQTRPFQRLRRVKQLGFSDLVYPGASHSRFAHSLGVFHTARQLKEIIESSKMEQNSKQQRALAAALVHDLGHGPFSHAFEKVGKRLGLKLSDHENMSDLLVRDSEVSEKLNELGSGFADDVANILKKDGVKTVHHAVVSSQFDADRLDYMRRDRLMTGTQHSAIDFPWLLANLEIGSVPFGVDDTKLGEVETFVLGPKAIYAAEQFVLGLFQLYPTVYFHKTTRGAEKIFTELLVRVVELVKDNSVKSTGLPKNHPLVEFARYPERISAALNLDDSVIWGALSLLSGSTDALVSEFSRRLRDRQLYKCCDIRNEVAHALDSSDNGGNEAVEKIDKCCASINEKLTEWSATNSQFRPRLLFDDEKRSPYKPVGQSKGPLDRINIRTAGGSLVDLAERSNVVAALKTFKLYRVYVDKDDAEARDVIVKTMKEEIENVAR
ncbi:HD domain-containing protein [Mesorhizobium sp. WSM3626]|uniref:HD domain-containing protein n=1 Tax=Mesorhizobium sp. WSM3626 TaxID=1040987 RepID=UPI0004B0A1BA|nr:HD domain-containing protein [Mesorhizobium sp. WSM3626]